MMSGELPRWVVGNAVISRVDEVTLDGQGTWLLPGATPELVGEVDWLDPSATDPDGGIRLSVHSFVVDVPGTRIVVDTGVGNGKVRDNPAWDGLDTDYVSRLTSAGTDLSSVDLVINTHLHRDHVGWNTSRLRDRWEPTFPNATYLVSRTEWDHWSAASLTEDQNRMFDDSVEPVRHADQLRLVDVETVTEIADGVELISTPGHTPGHVSVRISSAGETALITGDFLHHPVQVAHSDLCCTADVDASVARQTRRDILTMAADTETLLLGSHFTHPTGGRIRRTSTGYVLHAVN